jgi:adenosylcobinamide-phosphate synthase
VVNRAAGAAGGLLLDLLIGEPPLRPHPLSVFGRVMKAVEGVAYRDARAAGVVHAGAGVLVGGLAGSALRSTAASTYLAVAPRALTAAAREVATALEHGDIDGARGRLLSLVGRDTDGFGEKDIARAAIESVAENTVDAVVAPALFGAIGGAPFALAYRAVNTMDASVGYRNDRYTNYGWASARLDDVANYVPARVTVGLVMAVRPRRRGEIWRAVREDAPGHPSPNAGPAEAAFAAALGLELGGVNSYAGRIEHRPALGRGRAPAGGDIGAAIRLCRDVTLALTAGLLALGLTAGRRADPGFCALGGLSAPQVHRISRRGRR